MSADLSTWADMTDRDRGAALLHLRKRVVEGREYALENYPAEYFDHPALVALDEEEASAHAATLRSSEGALTHEEYARLYDLALEADSARLRVRAHEAALCNDTVQVQP